MKRLFSSQTIREADQKAFSSLRISGTTLMENAGRNVTEQLLKHFPSITNPLVLVGPGNNGGDGLVLARHFLVHGITPSVILSRQPSMYRGETLENLRVLEAILPEVCPSESMTDSEIDHCIQECDIVIDALLGTGATGTPRGEVLRLIRKLPKDFPVVSIDIPSGVDPTSGQICEDVVQADLTLTLLASKPGLHAYPGAGCSGKVLVCDIGIPPETVLPREAFSFLADRTDLPGLLPERRQDIHKGNRGSLLIMGGSTCFRGAMVLACKGALRAGAGVVVAAVPEHIASDLCSVLPEVVVFPIPTSDGYLHGDSLERCLSEWAKKRFSAMVLGPGLGRTEDTADLALRAWREWDGPLVLDADALFGVSRADGVLPRRGNAVLTPHEGEAGNLMGVSAETVRSNRMEAARNLSAKWGTVLLKGPGSIIDNGLHSYILDEGHPCLSVPGSGDVLSGAIGAFLASGISSTKACLAGSLLHAVAGGCIGARTGTDGILAGQIADEFPRIINHARNEGLQTKSKS